MTFFLQRNFLKLITFTALLFILLACITRSSGIVPQEHKPLNFNVNHHKEAGSSLMLSFTVSDSNQVKIYRGYSFIVTFPNGSFPDNVASSCSLKNGNVMISNIDTITDFASQRIICKCNNSFALGGLLLDKEISVTLNNMFFLSNVYDSLTVSLVTNENNGVVVYRNSAFSNFAVYDDYENMTDNDYYLRYDDFQITNFSNSLSCKAPCKNLYPFSYFSISFSVEILRHISSENTLFIFKLSGDLMDSLEKNKMINSIKIKSRKALDQDTFYESNDPYFSALRSSQLDGLLSFVYLGNGMFAIKDIAKYLNTNPSNKNEVKLNLIPGRRFILELDGFYSGSNVNMPLLTNFESIIKWKNANSYLSYTSYSTNIRLHTTVKPLGFSVVSESSEEDSESSVQVKLLEDSVFYLKKGEPIYENASFPLKFDLTIPQTPVAGKLRITHLANENTIFSFFTSTCDFSENIIADYNVFGTRKLCVPLYHSYGDKTYKQVSSTSSDNISSFEIKMDAITGTSENLIFSIWGFANKCSDTVYNDVAGGLIYQDSFFTEHPKSFNLKFKYEFIDENGKSLISRSFVSSLECFKAKNPSRDSYYEEASNVASANSDNIFVFENTNTGEEADTVLYRDFYNWNPFLYTPNSNQHIDNTSFSVGRTNYLSEIEGENKENIMFSLLTNLSSSENLSNYPLPYTTRISPNGGNWDRNPSLLRGKLEFTVSENIVKRTEEENCFFSWFTVDGANVDNSVVWIQEAAYSWDTFTLSGNKFITNDGNYNSDIDNDNDIDTAQDILSVYNSNFKNQKLGFSSNCFIYNTYSNYKVKNIFESVEFTYKFHRYMSDNVYAVNRVGTFRKFFTGENGFHQLNGFTTASSSRFPMIVYAVPGSDKRSDNNLCIVEVENSLFEELNVEHNLLIITLQGFILPSIGDFGSQDYYPISQAHGNTKAIPMYSETANDVNYQNTGNYNTLKGLNNGYYEFPKTNVFGSSIAIFDFEDSKVTDENIFNGSLYIPVLCPRFGSSLIRSEDSDYLVNVQSFTLNQSAEINKSDNHYFYKNFGGRKYITLSDIALNQNANSVFNESTTSVKDIPLRFKHYLFNRDSDFINDLDVTDSKGINTFYNIILLTNNVEVSSDASFEDGLFGYPFVKGNVNSFKLNGVSYNNIFFSEAKIGDTEEFGINKKINFLIRPDINVIRNDMRIHLQGVGKTQDASCFNGGPVRCDIHFSNVQDDTNFIATYSGTSNPVVPDDGVALDFKAKVVGQSYRGDSGAIFDITAVVYSNINISGNLTMKSSNFIADLSICVFNSNPEKVCHTSSEGDGIPTYVICSDIDLERDAFNEIKLTCYNVLMPNTEELIINKDGTVFSSQDSVYLNVFLSENKVFNFSIQAENEEAENVDINPDVNTIKPAITNLAYSQSNQNGGLGTAFLQVDLKRALRVGQTIVITGDINSIYPYKTSENSLSLLKSPACGFFFTKKSKTQQDLEKYNFYDGEDAYFVNKCRIYQYQEPISLKVYNRIEIRTRFYVPKTNEDFSRYLLIKINPVVAKDLSNIRYTINTFLSNNTKDFTSRRISQGEISESDNQPLFPVANFNKNMFYPNFSNENGLCNLSSIFPRIPTYSGEFTFTINLEGSSEYLRNTVNNSQNSTTNNIKILNEISIFFDPIQYQRHNDIFCYYNLTEMPCEWTTNGYINIRFSEELVDKSNHTVVIRGVRVPSFAFETEEDVIQDNDKANFFCSVNYFFNDVRENIYVGRGKHVINTYNSVEKGNIIFLHHPDGAVFHHEPLIKNIYNFRFSLDYTQDFTDVNQVLSGENNKTPVILVGFPTEYYNFEFDDLKDLSGSLYYTLWDEQTREYHRSEEGIKITVSRKYNYIHIKLPNNPFEILKNTVYFDLKLENVPSAFQNADSSAITFTLLNDEENPTSIFKSYNNLINSFNNPLKDMVDNYYRGPSFYFENKGKAQILANISKLTVYPGRYSEVIYTLSGDMADVSTEISLRDNQHFNAIEKTKTLNSGNSKSAKYMIGTSCNTLYGSYFIFFETTNKDDFYRISPLRINVPQYSLSQERVRVRNTTFNNNITDLVSFSMARKSSVLLYIYTERPVFSDLLIGVSLNESNNSSFKINENDIENGNLKISKYTKSKSFMISIGDYELDKDNQKMTLSSKSKCFRFANGNSQTIEIIVNREVTSLKDVQIKNMFTYMNIAKDYREELMDKVTRLQISENQISINVSGIPKYTRGVFALICNGSKLPTYDDLLLQRDDINTLLYQTQHVIFNKNEDKETHSYTLNFKNLQRGTQYKFMALINNWGEQTVKLESPLLVMKNQTGANSTMTTTNVFKKTYLRMRYNSPQNPDVFKRIVYMLQKKVDREHPQALITVSNTNNYVIKGHSIMEKEICEVDSEVVQERVEQETEGTRMLRFLQETDEPTTQEDPGDSVSTDPSNNTDEDAELPVGDDVDESATTGVNEDENNDMDAEAEVPEEESPESETDNVVNDDEEIDLPIEDLLPDELPEIFYPDEWLKPDQPTYLYTEWIVFTQQPNSSVIFDISSYSELVKEEINTPEKLNNQLQQATLNLKRWKKDSLFNLPKVIIEENTDMVEMNNMEMNMQTDENVNNDEEKTTEEVQIDPLYISRVYNTQDYSVDIPQEKTLSSEKFLMRLFTFDYRNHVASFIPEGPYEILCYWKIKNVGISTINNTLLDKEQILDCENKELYPTCGTVIFRQNNERTTYIDLVELGKGNYFIDVYCPSPYPLSKQEITITHDKPISLDGDTNPIDHIINNDCANEKGICYTETLRLAIMLLLLLVALVL